MRYIISIFLLVLLSSCSFKALYSPDMQELASEIILGEIKAPAIYKNFLEDDLKKYFKSTHGRYILDVDVKISDEQNVPNYLSDRTDIPEAKAILILTNVVLKDAETGEIVLTFPMNKYSLYPLSESTAYNYMAERAIYEMLHQDLSVPIYNNILMHFKFENK